MSNKKLGIGSKLQIESATPGTYTDIAGIESIKPSLGELAMVEATEMESPDHGVEKVPGLIDWGTVEFEGNYSGDATQLACITAMQGRTEKNFKVVFPTDVSAGGKTIAFSGYVTKFSPDASNPKDGIRFSGSITVNSKPTLS